MLIPDTTSVSAVTKYSPSLKFCILISIITITNIIITFWIAPASICVVFSY